MLDRKGVLWSDEAIDTIRANLVAIVAELSAMARELQRNSEGLTAGPVLRRVIEVERRCKAIHAETLARSADPEVRAFFASLTKPDVRVEQLLEQALRSQSAPAHGVGYGEVARPPRRVARTEAEPHTSARYRFLVARPSVSRTLGTRRFGGGPTTPTRWHERLLEQALQA